MIDRSVISQVLLQATSLRQKGDSLSEDLFDIWFNYSYNMLILASNNNSLAPMYYLSFANNMRNGALRPYQKLDICCNYLNSLY